MGIVLNACDFIDRLLKPGKINLQEKLEFCLIKLRYNCLKGKQMTIELQFNSVTIQHADMQENYPLMFSAIQPYLPVHNSPKRRRPRKKKERVADLIDTLIDSIDSL